MTALVPPSAVRRAACALIAFLCVDGADLRAQAAPDARFEALASLVESKRKEYGVPGVALGIIHDGHVTIRGFGVTNVEDSIPVNAHTVFPIASISKTFAATAIMRLVEQGKLSLDDPLSKYRPEFPRAAEVTVRQLLNHTSGIMSYTHPRVASQIREAGRRDWTTDQLIARIATLEPAYEFDPGTGWSYSNSGYILLGAIIEKVSGMSYAEYLRTALLEPLGLAHTAVDDLALVVPDRASGYEPSKKASSGFRNADFIPMSAAGPAGAMRSTAADLLKWSLALFGGQVLQPATLAMMTTPARLKDGRLASKGRLPPIWIPETTEYGFGLFLGVLDGRATTGHGGAIFGFNTWLETFRDQGVTIAVMTNTGYPSAEKTGPKVADAWFKTMAVP